MPGLPLGDVWWPSPFVLDLFFQDQEEGIEASRTVTMKT